MKIFNYHMIIEYDGTKFIGWQIQKKGLSVQGEIQKTLKRFLKEDIKLIGSGRTDAGVHAIGQSANFKTVYKIDTKKFIGTLNHFLKSKNISILSLKKKDTDFNARFSALERKYNYIIFNRGSHLSLYKNRAWHVKKKLNIKDMKKAAKILSGKNDFTAFRSSSCNAKSPIRTLKQIIIKKSSNGLINISFVSKSFLQQQVRSMVGCLKFVGEGKWNLKRLKKTLYSKKRSMCAPPAPPTGLYLEKVKY